MNPGSNISGTPTQSIFYGKVCHVGCFLCHLGLHYKFLYLKDKLQPLQFRFLDWWSNLFQIKILLLTAEITYRFVHNLSKENGISGI
jgi:hypothetical protein